jgi:hypothetical protein
MTLTSVQGVSAISSIQANAGTATFNVMAPAAGTYVVWGKVLSPSFAADSFFVSVNGGPEDVYDDAEGKWSPNWQWTVVNGRNGSSTPNAIPVRTFNLVAGVNSIVFRGREMGSLLDEILVTNDLSFVPTAGSGPTPVPPVTGAGSLSGSVSTPASTQSLSSIGTSDWAHWGRSGTTGYDHKAGVTPLISNYSAIGNGTVHTYSNNPFSFSWTGGTPMASITTSTGVYVSGQNNGFKLTAPADGTQRSLTVYVGVWSAQGKVVAHLSDNSAPDYTDTSLVNANTTTPGLYTFTYKAASSGQTLVVTFTQNNSTGGNITLEGATLR